MGPDSENYRKSSQSRLLCFVVTAIAKLATYHRELLPRARVSLGKVCLLLLIIVCYYFPFKKKTACSCSLVKHKRGDYISAIVGIQLELIKLGIGFQVARSRISDARVWKRARDYLGLMNDPAICLSILGPSRPSQHDIQKPGTVNWSEGGRKMVAHFPFYILGEQKGQA